MLRDWTDFPNNCQNADAVIRTFGFTLTSQIAHLPAEKRGSLYKGVAKMLDMSAMHQPLVCDATHESAAGFHCSIANSASLAHQHMPMHRLNSSKWLDPHFCLFGLLTIIIKSSKIYVCFLHLPCTVLFLIMAPLYAAVFGPSTPLGPN